MPDAIQVEVRVSESGLLPGHTAEAYLPESGSRVSAIGDTEHLALVALLEKLTVATDAVETRARRIQADAVHVVTAWDYVPMEVCS